jgi:hypothetical protein
MEHHGETLTRAEAARLIGVHPMSLYRLSVAGEGPPYFRLRDGRGVYRYPRVSLQKWIKERMHS